MSTQDAPKQSRQKTKREARLARRAAKERFKKAHQAEKAFGRKLKSVAAQIGSIIKELAPGGVVKNFGTLNETLRRYAELIKPWAESVSQSLIAEVGRRDLASWTELGSEMGRTLKKEVMNAQTGEAMRKIMNEQVHLITSLPREAAKRVHKLTIEGMSGGTRAKQIQKEIMRSGKVTESRAMLIARTETTRTATAMVESRARHVGSEGYIWRSAEDSDVRQRHKKLDGKFFKWDSPPVAGENGERYHPGAGPNCRCYPEPVITD